MNRKFAGILILIIATVGLNGCAKSDGTMTATVQGTVTIEGELAPRGKVSFHAASGGPAANGTIHDDGTFTLRVGRGKVGDQDASRIPAGEYTATVVVNDPSTVDPEHPSGPPVPGARLTAAKYSISETSGLKYTIKAGLNIVDIDVKAPSAEELAVEEPTSEAEDVDATSDEAADDEEADDDKEGEDEEGEDEEGDDEGDEDEADDQKGDEDEGDEEEGDEEEGDDDAEEDPDAADSTTNEEVAQ